MSREIEHIAPYIDHTLLKPTATKEDVQKFCEEALAFDFASVCIPPYYVKLASDILVSSTINVCTVIGFPLGYNPKKIKELEIRGAMDNGAEELDIVVNQSLIQSGLYEEVLDEMVAINKLVHSQYGLTKFIVETAHLSSEQSEIALQLCLESGADFIKTSTGFASKGAELAVVKKWQSMIGSKKLKIKASGGIKNSKEALSFISGGASRIGCSRGISIVKEYENR